MKIIFFVFFIVLSFGFAFSLAPHLLGYLDKKPVNMIDLTGKNTEYKVVVFNDNHANGFYYIEAVTFKNNKKHISYAPIMHSPLKLEPFINKKVTIKGKFIQEDGLTNQCRKGWENWCKSVSSYGTNELHLLSIEIVK